jgi:hypothetical protein
MKAGRGFLRTTSSGGYPDGLMAGSFEPIFDASRGVPNMDDTRHESAAEFYGRLIRGREEDVDLDALLAEHREPHSGVDL